MTKPRFFGVKTNLLTSLATIIALALCARASEEVVDGVEAVNSRVASDYVRARTADGHVVPEYYSFGKGGVWGGPIADDSIDHMGFLDVAHVVAPALASQNYLPASDPAKTRLIIMVYWGTTGVAESLSNSVAVANYQSAANNPDLTSTNNAIQNAAMSQMSEALTMLSITNRLRDQTDFKNAAMLGYDSEGTIGTDYGRYISHTALGTRAKDDVAEIEMNRYFVVLMAYDFQLIWKEKKHKLLWETRFSINEGHNRFDHALPVLSRYASQYFGQPTNGLQRSRVLDGNVEIGAPTMVQFMDDPKDRDARK
jgi:hypothetical protein